MSYIGLNDHMHLKNYTANVKGTKSVVRIEIEVSEPGALGWLLEDLGKIQRDQAQAEKAKKEAARKAAKATTLALPAPLRQLPYFGDGEA